MDTRKLVAEVWLIASDDESRLSALWTDLKQSTSKLTVWRAKHGQVSLLPIAALTNAVVDALATGSASVHVYADMSAGLDQLMHDTVKPVDEHRVTAIPWPADATPTLLEELTQPDAWIELSWLYNDCRGVAPLTSLDGDSDSIIEHQQAFEQWAQTKSPEELAELRERYSE